jgi:hypothetical protein
MYCTDEEPFCGRYKSHQICSTDFEHIERARLAKKECLKVLPVYLRLKKKDLIFYI